jgi:hypothetical protein
MTITDLLDGVEPDCWRYETVRGTYRYRGPCINFDKDYNSLKPVGLLTFKRVEALLAANRKLVLLEAAEVCGKNMDRCAEYTEKFGDDTAEAYAVSKKLYNELRRMALEPTGVDKGERE